MIKKIGNKKRKNGRGLFLFLMMLLIAFTGITIPIDTVKAAMPPSTAKAHYDAHGIKVGYFDDGHIYWADRYTPSSAGIKWRTMGFRVHVTANNQSTYVDYSSGGGSQAPYNVRSPQLKHLSQSSGGYNYNRDGVNYNELIKGITAKNATIGRNMSSGDHSVRVVFEAIAETYNASTNKRLGGPFFTQATAKAGLEKQGIGTSTLGNYYGITLNIAKADLPIVKYVTKGISFPNGGGYFHTGKTYYVKPGKLVYINTTYKSQKVNMTNQYFILGDKRGSGIENVDDYATNYAHATGKFVETNGSGAITWSTNSTGPGATNLNTNSLVRNAFSFVKDAETWWAYSEARNNNGVYAGGSTLAYEELYGFHTDGTIPTFSGIPASTWRNTDLTFTPVADDTRSGLAVSTITVNGKLAQTITSPAARTTKATFTARTATGSTTGTSTYIIEATDNVGNKATRTFHVNIDKTLPTGNLAQTPTTATNGNVTLNLTAIADAGGSGYYRTKLPNGSFVTTTTASQAVSANGTYSFVIYDNAGNATTKSITVSNIDKTAPTGNIAQASTAWTNGNVTLNLTAIADTGGSGYYRTKLPNGTFVTTTTASQAVTANGVHSFVIYDNAGNSTTKSITVSNIDKTAPTGNLAQASTTATNGNVTLNLTAIADTGGSGYYRTKLPNGTFVTTTTASQAVTANGTHSFVIYDNAGNATTKSITVSNIDKTVPTGNLVQTPTTATNGNVTLNLTAIADAGGSGLKNTKLPNGTLVTGTSASQTVSANGTYSFIIYDNAGNSTTKSITVSNIDKTAPTGNLVQTPTTPTNGNVSLNLTAIADAGGSGLKNTKLPNGTFVTGTTASQTVTANGTYNFVIYDNAGNTTTKSITVSNIDKTVPTGNLVQTPTTATNGNVTLNLTAIADTGGSGLKNTKLPNGTLVTGATASQTVTANGTYSFIIYDNAGNTTTKSITVSNIDKTAPTGNLAQTPTAWTNGNVTLNLTAIADTGGSGLKNTKLPNGTLVTGTTASQSVTANGVYSFVIYDNAGNSTTKSITVTNIEKVAPTGNLAQTPTTPTNGNVTLSLTGIADTGGSGLKNTKLPNNTLVTGTTASQVVTANGTYNFIIYDNAGNATTKSITVSNIDKTAPTGNLVQTPTAWTNGSVTLNLTAIADTGGAGLRDTKLPNGTIVTTTTASQTVTVNGTYSFVITDKAGNATTKSITVTNIDKTAPTGNLVQTPTTPTNGNVTLNLTAIADTGGSGLKNTKLPNGTFVTTATASQTVSANGTYSFIIYDNAGNTTTKSITVSNIDKTAPTGNLVQTPTAWTNGSVTLNLTAIADTGGSGLRDTKLPNGTIVTTTTASQTVTVNGTYSFVITDKAGNSTTKSITVTNIEKVAPSGNLTQTPTTATNGNVTLNLTAITDTGGSGLKNTKLPNGTLVTGTTASQVVSENGTYVFTMYDNAGNARTNSITVSNIDKTAPTGNLVQTPTTATNGNVTLNLTAIADTGGSGYYRTKLPNGTFVTTTTASQTVSANGTYSFVIYDNAGNSTTKSITVSNIDKTAPTGNLAQTPTAWTNGNVTLNLTAIADTGGSGLKNIKLPNGTLVTGVSASQLVTVNGTYDFVIYDNAGNSTTKSITVTNIDKIAPTANLAQTPTVWTNGNVTLNLSSVVDTGGSGLKNIKLPNGTLVTGTSASQAVTVNGTYSFVVTDNAGNSITKSIVVTNIDKTVPTANLAQTPTAWTNGDVTLNLSSVVDTGGSGLKNIKLPNGTLVTGTSASQVVSVNGAYSFVITDNAGNTTTKSITVGNIDKVKPGGTVTFVPGDTALTIRYTATDNLSGVKSITLPDNSVVSGSIATYNVTKPGTYTATVLDNAGNKESIVATVHAPNVTITKEVGSWTNRKTYGLTVKTSPRYVTSAKIQTTFEGASWTTANTKTAQISKNGTYEFKVNDGGIIATGSISITNFDREKSIISIKEKTKSDSNATYTIRITEVGDVKP